MIWTEMKGRVLRQTVVLLPLLYTADDVFELIAIVGGGLPIDMK